MAVKFLTAILIANEVTRTRRGERAALQPLAGPAPDGARAGFLDDLDEQRVFLLSERFDSGTQVDVDREITVGKEQAMNVGHPRRASLLVIC